MKTLLLPFALLFLAVDCTHARIGETEAQVEARLGNGRAADPSLEVEPSCTAKAYQKGDFTVTVIFYQGVSQYEQYKKEHDRITETELDTILQNNAFGGEWTKSLDGADLSSWHWTGDKMEAVYVKMRTPPFLYVQTAAYRAFANSTRTSKEKSAAASL